MKKYNICKFWTRFYSSPQFFNARVRAGGLLNESQPRGNLWSFFRTPGNITFVTTNIVTFVGIVTYDTFVSANEERIFEERLAVARLSVEKSGREGIILEDTVPMLPQRRPSGEEYMDKQAQDKELAKLDDQIEILRKELEERKKLDLQLRQMEANIEEEAVDSPLQTYTASEVTLRDKGKVKNLVSQRVKMSLFQMVYSFYSYKSALLSQNKDIEPEMDEFYHFWSEKYGQVNCDMEKVKEFKLPDWQKYPNLMKKFCYQLYDREIRRLSDFEHIYYSADSRELKQLLRLWLYDNWYLLKPTLRSDEVLQRRDGRFFKDLVRDSRGDQALFSKYMSIVTQDNPRSVLFFQQDKFNLPSISLATYVSLLETSERTHHNLTTVRLIQLLKTNCYLDKNQHVRILLAPPEGLQTPQMAKSRRICYRYLSKDRRLTALLDTISK
ncbi:hypothetical protein J7297_00573 [Nakaseomyces glabratus]|nr:hypothetical protein J7298_00571 [Nakaseomyces glabratus]KAH7591209.1 hypothetical protein J7297_00573 [Nakaseomyces glabratus]KAH7597465.1 hypothetical protein J7296_00569 [Nakaseomyces glabratus]KAH7607886.1 hypothetical protein J7295_00572 [Nakaseomyces glabratus]KAH7615037.1 hypothetical protein J7292_00569 [Nakaseomyces glabratus]